jgi:hypothetical protein
MIEREVADTLQSIGQRLEKTKIDGEKKSTTTETYALKSTVRKYEEHSEDEQVTVSWKDLDTLLNHMKNSRVEKRTSGEILYVNKFYAAKTQWERPTGYIKHLAQSSRQSSVTPSKGSRD